MFGRTRNIAESDRVILMAEKDSLAGDLAAWLSGSFTIIRVRQYAEVVRELRRRPRAVVMALEGTGESMRMVPAMVRRCRERCCRLVILGGDPAECPPDVRELVAFLPSYPEPRMMLAALAAGGDAARQARS